MHLIILNLVEVQRVVHLSPLMMMDLSLVHVHIFEPAGMPSRDA